MGEVEDLYGRPLTGFVEGRNELAKELAKSGDKAAAAEVKALRKPTVPLWGLNQAARRAPEDLAALLDATERLRQATESGDRTALAEASAARKEALGALRGAARGALEEAGHAASAAHLEEVVQMLLAASMETSIHDELVAGALRSEPEASPFGAEVALRAVPDAEDDGAGAEKAAAEERRRAAERLDKEAAAAEREALRLDAEAERAEGVARKARSLAKRAERKAERLRDKADEALNLID